MSNFASLARRCATGLVATQMLLGAVSVSTLALAAPVQAAESAPFSFPQAAPAAPQTPAPTSTSPNAAPQPAPAAQPAAPQPTPIVSPQPAAPQAPAAPAPQGISFLAQHGGWQGFTTTVDGVQYAGVMTRMSSGGIMAATATKDGQYALLMADPSWNLRDGMTVPVRLTIEGRVYTLTATAHGNRLEMPGVIQAVLQDLLQGSQAQLDVGNGAVVWTVALAGILDAAQDAAKVIGA